MEHNMRRIRQLLPTELSKDILHDATNGVLSLVDTDGTPYGVPLSFVYDDNGHIYFHAARTGHKIDCIMADSRCSFCIVAADNIMPEEFTTYFRSVIVHGNIHIVSDSDEILRGLDLLCRKYSPGVDAVREIERGLGHVLVLRLDIHNISGKESIELVNRRH